MKRLVERILGKADAPLSRAGQSETMPASGTQPGLPDGLRVYCIGDIHGRLDLLEELHDLVRSDAAGHRRSRKMVYLGDYIDRGAQSKQVLDLLCGDPLPGFDPVYLLGNHERAMLDFLAHPHEAAGWLAYGGRATLASYGVGPARLSDAQDPGWLRSQLEARLPPKHRTFLNDCQLMHIEGSYCFVHAGIRPGRPLEEQDADDLLWIREDFTRSRADHGCIVVHGHTISDEAELLPNRIGIDTGAFYSGTLTCLVLEGATQRLLQTGRTS